MANRAAKAENKLQRICNELGVTQSGHFWMDHAVDPFKDLVKPHPGYPDKTAEPSVVEVVKQTVVVSAPGAVNWDCNIFLDQALFSTSLYATTFGNNTYQRGGQGATAYKRGGLVVRKANTGSQMDITTTDNNSCLQVDPNLYTNEDCRVIAMGFEVHDTTQELKKQGSVVVYRLDQPTEQAVSKTISQDGGTTACQTSSVSTVRLLQPPWSQAAALDTVGALQWEAKEGVYVVPTQCVDVNPPMASRAGMSVHCFETPNYFFPQISSAGAQNLVYSSDANVPSPWSLSGAFFAGLDPAATLTINFNYMIERFPNQASTIRRLCYPSPQYDPKAMELYSVIARSMPTGVTVDQNGLGDWIAGIANIASGALSLIPHPVPKLIGAGIQAVGNNKLVKIGGNQIVKEIERKIEEKVEKNVTNTPNRIVMIDLPKSGGARQGNYIPPKGKKAKRPDRLKEYGKSAMGPDNPWQKPKMHNSKPGGSNM